MILTNLYHIYPSIFFKYDLKQKRNIKFGFGRRVERPGDWLLTPLPRVLQKMIRSI